MKEEYVDAGLYVIAYLIGFGLMVGASMGWGIALHLAVSEWLLPRLREARGERRTAPQTLREA